MNQTPGPGAVDPRWKGLCKAGGVSAQFIAVLLACEIIVFSVWPQPDTVIDYFTLFRRNRFIGLLDLDLPGMVAYILFIPVIGDVFALLISVYFAAIVFLVMWVAMTGRRLCQLGSEGDDTR